MPQSYKIPQNVDLEDKILGPLTLKQFFYALFASLATFIAYQVAGQYSLFGFIFLAFLIWTIAIAFIFVRPNEQPFSRFITSFLNFVSKPQQRIWKRLPTLGEVSLVDAAAAPKVVDEGPTYDEVRSRLQQLAHVVDTRGWAAADAGMGQRVTGGDAQTHYNLEMPQFEEPEDVLAEEDEGGGPGRASRSLDEMLRQGVKKPDLPDDAPSLPKETVNG